MQRLIEHCDAIRHVVQGHPQLGLTVAKFSKEAGIFDSDNSLVGKGGS